MNKPELITQIAEHANVSKTTASACLDAFRETVKEALCKGEIVSISGFGTFKVVEHAERTARNPRTGETILVSASRTPSFKAGKTLKDALN